MGNLGHYCDGIYICKPGIITYGEFIAKKSLLYFGLRLRLSIER